MIGLQKIDLQKAVNARRVVQSAKRQACLGMWGVGGVAVRRFAAEQRGISSAGRAPALQAGGRRFDPVILNHLELIRKKENKNKNKNRNKKTNEKTKKRKEKDKKLIWFQ